MIVNGFSLLRARPIKNMLREKVKHNGVSHGLSEAGFDLRIRQRVHFCTDHRNSLVMVDSQPAQNGRFTLASAVEEFDMPPNLVGIVHDKSTWARQGLSVFNTVIEPGFKGGLTLELVYHGHGELIIPAGSGIAQVIFHFTSEEARYAGKYQGQSTNPEPARDT